MNKTTIALTLATLALATACSESAKPIPNVANKAAASTPVAGASASPSLLQQEHDHAAEDNAPRISLADAKKDFDAKTAVFIDTHTKEQFELEHIPGAINIQANTIKQNLDKVPKGKKIIVYCS